MNLEAIKSRLDRLNRFYEFMAGNPDDISKLDRDSFLMQLRELYHLALEEDLLEPTHTQATTNSKELVEEAVEKVEETPKKLQKKGPKFIFNTPKVTEKKEPKPIEDHKEELPPQDLKKEPLIKEEKKTQKEPPKVELPQEQKVEKAEPKKEPLKEVKVEAKKEEKQIVEPKAEPKHKDEGFNEDYEELFFHKQATDLAAKLSESPIKDLSEKLSINEKLRYINELFGGDVARFKESIDFLNKANGFESARSFMEQNLVDEYDWMNKRKMPLAKEFIKFVRRRYL